MKPKRKPTKPTKAWFIVRPDGTIQTHVFCRDRFETICRFLASRGDNVEDENWNEWKKAGYRVERLTIGGTNG